MASARSGVGEAIRSEQVSVREALMARDHSLVSVSNLHEVYCDDVLASTSQEQPNIYNPRSREMRLEEFVRTVTLAGWPLTSVVPIPYQEPEVTVAVLTQLGQRILHGVLSCVLSAHTAYLAYHGHCGMDDLRVLVHEGVTVHVYVVSRVYAGSCARTWPPLDAALQQQDYLALLGVLETLFPQDTLHVGSTIMLLDSIAGGSTPEGEVGAYPTPPLDLALDNNPDNTWKRTQLLRAHTAIASSPVGVATACINLKRFYDQLPAESDENKQRFTFRQAMGTAQKRTCPLQDAIREQPLFRQVNGHEPEYRITTHDNGQTLRRVPNNLYAENYGLELLNFARNWFTHVPAQRPGIGGFDGLPHLDQIFTYHFANFLPEALLQLYTLFDDRNLLTELTHVLVPLG